MSLNIIVLKKERFSRMSLKLFHYVRFAFKILAL